MGTKKATPRRAQAVALTTMTCDLKRGSKRYVARLACGGSGRKIKAIWRNEMGSARVTGPKVRS